MRNIYQCLEDFNIPLYTSKTVTRVFGEGRLCAVEVSDVDEDMTPIPGTRKIIECDALILSVGLIPENELAESIGLPMDSRTKGPVTDQNSMSMVNGVFCCGNALHVNDLVDYVSESGEAAGRAAARYLPEERTFAQMNADDGFLYVVPQMLSITELTVPVTVYFRSKTERGKTRLSVTVDGREIYWKVYSQLRPPEMERIEINFKGLRIIPDSYICFALAEVD